jgi:hypothetical protein
MVVALIEAVLTKIIIGIISKELMGDGRAISGYFDTFELAKGFFFEEQPRD